MHSHKPHRHMQADHWSVHRSASSVCQAQQSLVGAQQAETWPTAWPSATHLSSRTAWMLLCFHAHHTCAPFHPSLALSPKPLACGRVGEAEPKQRAVHFGANTSGKPCASTNKQIIHTVTQHVAQDMFYLMRPSSVFPCAKAGCHPK
jgi:hypothetical protein